jgi:hypothetical protein
MPDLVLGVMGIIQGLAFNELASKVSSVGEGWDHLTIVEFYLCFSICFLIIIRVFQTYVAAVFDYARWSLTFWDVLGIFIVGLLEYWIFSGLAVDRFSSGEMHGRISVLFLFAAIAHGNALYQIRYSTFLPPEKKSSERRLQLFNLLSALLAGMGCLGSWVYSLSEIPAAIVSIVMIGLISSNVRRSIGATFGR